MTAKQPPAIYQDVAISRITVPANHRAINQAKVDSIAGSIREVGLLNPVGLVRSKEPAHEFRLNQGAHRLAACKQLGWETVPAFIREFDQLHAELAELDENLQRQSFTILEESQAYARRKKLYLALHPETAAVNERGGPGRGKKTSVKMTAVSYAEDAAQKAGRSRSTIERRVRIGEHLDSEAAELLKGTPAESHEGRLLAIAKLPAEQQRERAREIRSEKSTSGQSVPKHLPQQKAAQAGLKGLEALRDALKVLGIADEYGEMLERVQADLKGCLADLLRREPQEKTPPANASNELATGPQEEAAPTESTFVRSGQGDTATEPRGLDDEEEREWRA